MRDKIVFLGLDVFDSNKGIVFVPKTPQNISFVRKCIFVNVSEYIYIYMSEWNTLDQLEEHKDQ